MTATHLLCEKVTQAFKTKTVQGKLLLNPLFWKILKMVDNALKYLVRDFCEASWKTVGVLLRFRLETRLSSQVTSNLRSTILSESGRVLETVLCPVNLATHAVAHDFPLLISAKMVIMLLVQYP